MSTALRKSDGIIGFGTFCLEREAARKSIKICNIAATPGSGVPGTHQRTRLALLRQKEQLQQLLPRAEEQDRLRVESTIASYYLPPAEALEKPLRYEIANERKMSRAMAQLERLQRQRKGEMVPPATVSRRFACSCILARIACGAQRKEGISHGAWNGNWNRPLLGSPRHRVQSGCEIGCDGPAAGPWNRTVGIANRLVSELLPVVLLPAAYRAADRVTRSDSLGTPFTNSRNRTLSSSLRNLTDRQRPNNRPSESSAWRFAPAMKSAQIISRQ